MELLKDNEDWGTEARRHELNQFMARLIFCFFAESTGIFLNRLFTETIRQMGDSQSGNTHEVIAELFRAMNTKREDLKTAKLRPWAEQFPYVNGGLFSGPAREPAFQPHRAHLSVARGRVGLEGDKARHIRLDDTGCADDDERGSLGLHYTSVPNILKVLNPLFLDDLRALAGRGGNQRPQTEEPAPPHRGDPLFAPACGSRQFPRHRV